MGVQSALTEEQQKLTEALEEIEKQYSEIGPRYYGNDFVEQILDTKRQETRERLKLLSNEPYFGRLDFREKNKDSIIPHYIGKRGMDKRGSDQPYIIDWRAPVASLFYSFTGGEAPVIYEAPEGNIEGEVLHKRNIYIRDKLLQRVVDSYVRGGDNMGLTDEFLLYRLGEKKDNRLRDIVSTIQAEQDRIIRAPRHMALIIQGAAGSGKTTVALHRLAYLLYQYQGHIRAERMMILAPNTMFLDYISGVLPELGVGNVEQTTFLEWSKQLLGDQVRLAEQTESVWFSVHSIRPDINEHTSGRFKGSLRFKQWMDNALKLYEKNYLQDIDYEAWDGRTLDKRQIRQWFDQEYAHYPLAVRRERLMGRMNRWMEMQLADIADPKKRKEKSKLAKQKLQAFMKKHPEIAPVKLYRSLFEQFVGEDIPERIIRDTLSYLKRGVVQVEDLAPLGWIHLTYHGADGRWLDHIVVDEAQDVSPFQIALLNGYMREPSFTILGDLAQGIHSYRGVNRWEELTDVFADEQTSYHELIQSYRSTLEIIEFANRILPYTDTGLPQAQPVFRSGEPVAVMELMPDEKAARVLSVITDNRARGMQTFAVIGRTHEDCLSIYEMLSEVESQVTLITEGQNDYRGGISVVPIFLAKGLEFDAVLLMDVDHERYTAAPQDAKLLYVGCTRALHHLTIMYEGQISPLIV